MSEVRSLREWRVARFLSVEALAARAGISAKTVWNLEHGKPAHGATLLKLAAALGIEPGQIEEAKR